MKNKQEDRSRLHFLEGGHVLSSYSRKRAGSLHAAENRLRYEGLEMPGRLEVKTEAGPESPRNIHIQAFAEIRSHDVHDLDHPDLVENIEHVEHSRESQVVEAERLFRPQVQVILGRKASFSPWLRHKIRHLIEVGEEYIPLPSPAAGVGVKGAQADIQREHISRQGLKDMR